MSYDVCISNHTFNYTFNVSDLFYNHFPKVKGDRRDGIHSLDGLTGKQAGHRISEFWESLNRERHRLYRQGAIGEPCLCARYDAPNGWGSLVGAMIFIAQIQSACAHNPRHIVRVFA